ncbi:MAG TPA: hypothetical protein VNW06_02635, partial [Cytophagaceae bacterium]|nr:hypothetical protein [Cytophagaceae bacterium]
MDNKKIIPAFVLIAYCIIAIIFTYPIVYHLSDAIIVDDPKNGDASQFIWDVYIFKKNILNFENPFYTNDLFYPAKANLLMHTYTPVIGIFALFFNNNFLALNMFLLASFILSAYGAYLLAKRYIENNVLCFLCGFIFSFSTYKTMHLLGHYHLMLTATIPFFILCFLNGFSYATKKFIPSIINTKYVLGCVVLFFITLLSDYYSSFFIIYFVILFSLYNKFLKDASINWRSYKTWGYILLIFVASHIIIRLLRLTGVDDKGAFYWQGDLLAYLVPPTNSSLYGETYSSKLISLFHIQRFGEGIVFFGYVFFFCVLIFFRDVFKGAIQKNIRSLVFLSLIFFCIIIPGLKINGKELLNLPTSIIHFIPFINNIRCSPRIFVMLSLFFPIAVFYSVDNLIKGLGIWRYSISIGIVALFIIEYKPKPYDLFYLNDVPEAMYYIKDLNENKVLMPIPTGIKDGLVGYGIFNTENLYFQTIHKKKVIGGYISRLDKSIIELYLSDSVMVNLFKKKKQKDTTITASSQKDADAFFAKFNPGIFVISPNYRNSFHEKYIYSLLANRKYTTKEISNYLI